MQLKIIKGFLAAGLLMLTVLAVAAPATLPDPTVELQSWSDQMIKALKTNQSSMKKDPQEVYDIVETILVPHCDVPLMARLALGRNVWNNATPAQQADFIVTFKNLMKRTYGAGLSSYTDEKVKVYPIRGGIPAGQNRVEVKTEILRTDGPNIAVSYRLIFQKNDWFVYDFCVEGVCMINSFNSQFTADISSGMPLEKLTQKLNKHNLKTQ